MSAIKVILSQEGYLVILVREEAGVDRATDTRACGRRFFTHACSTEVARQQKVREFECLANPPAGFLAFDFRFDLFQFLN